MFILVLAIRIKRLARESVINKLSSLPKKATFSIGTIGEVNLLEVLFPLTTQAHVLELKMLGDQSSDSSINDINSRVY